MSSGLFILFLFLLLLILILFLFLFLTFSNRAARDAEGLRQNEERQAPRCSLGR
jgi:flagellar biosynthesis/type III secretory pathway M-ring protein FliF/YscJ